MKHLKANLLLLTGFVLAFTFFQYYLTYLISEIGENRFYDTREHLASLVMGLNSLLATLLAARWVGEGKGGQVRGIFKIFGLSTLLFALLAAFSHSLHRWYFYSLSTSLDFIWGYVVLGFFFYHLVIAGVILAWFFYLRNQQHKLQLAQAENERKQMELRTLRHHLEPHFLFNNLSVLSALVEQQNGNAGAFISHFAELYRHLVRQQNQDVVTLQEELEFLHHYFFLIEQRFGALYQLKVGPLQAQQAVLPPASLQLLVENAVKHNVARADQPVVIHVEQEGDYLMVWNRKCLKLPAKGGGTGLQNLQRRYSLLNDKKVILAEDDRTFTVKLPLLRVLAHEYSDIGR